MQVLCFYPAHKVMAMNCCIASKLNFWRYNVNNTNNYLISSSCLTTPWKNSNHKAWHYLTDLVACSVGKALFHRTFSTKQYQCTVLILWLNTEEILIKLHKNWTNNLNIWKWDMDIGLWKAATYSWRIQKGAHKYRFVGMPRNDLSGLKLSFLADAVVLCKQEVKAESLSSGWSMEWASQHTHTELIVLRHLKKSLSDYYCTAKLRRNFSYYCTQ